jgi:hypothetical protein
LRCYPPRRTPPTRSLPLYLIHRALPSPHLLLRARTACTCRAVSARTARDARTAGALVSCAAFPPMRTWPTRRFPPASSSHLLFPCFPPTPICFRGRADGALVCMRRGDRVGDGYPAGGDDHLPVLRDGGQGVDGGRLRLLQLGPLYTLRRRRRRHRHQQRFLPFFPAEALCARIRRRPPSKPASSRRRLDSSRSARPGPGCTQPVENEILLNTGPVSALLTGWPGWSQRAGRSPQLRHLSDAAGPGRRPGWLERGVSQWRSLRVSVALFTRLNGVVYTPQWRSLHASVALFTRLSGALYTSQWRCLHASAALFTRLNGVVYTPQRRSLHVSMALFTRLSGALYTSQWRCLHASVALFTRLNGVVYTPQRRSLHVSMAADADTIET